MLYSMDAIRKLSLILGTIFSPFFLFSQINFEQISIEDAFAKAQAENKIVFVDAYAVWCGPCKWMDNNVFSDKQVGQLYNEKFVNLKINMESSEGKVFGKKYTVSAYPTFLYLDAKGNIVHQTQGAMDAKIFTAEVKKVFNKSSNTQSKTKGATLNYEKEASKFSKTISNCFSNGLDNIFEEDILLELEKIAQLKSPQRIEIYMEEMSESRKERFNLQVNNAMVYTNNIGDCFKETTNSIATLVQQYPDFDLCEMQQSIVAQLKKSKKQKVLAIWYDYYALNTVKQ